LFAIENVFFYEKKPSEKCSHAIRKQTVKKISLVHFLVIKTKLSTPKKSQPPLLRLHRLNSWRASRHLKDFFLKKGGEY
jgi:hypothetical protein